MDEKSKSYSETDSGYPHSGLLEESAAESPNPIPGASGTAAGTEGQQQLQKYSDLKKDLSQFFVGKLVKSLEDGSFFDGLQLPHQLKRDPTCGQCRLEPLVNHSSLIRVSTGSESDDDDTSAHRVRRTEGPPPKRIRTEILRSRSRPTPPVLMMEVTPEEARRAVVAIFRR